MIKPISVKRRQTLVLDIEDSLVSKVEIQNSYELAELRKSADYLSTYIEVERKVGSVIEVYKIRPYTFEFLRALEPFCEMIVFSNMSQNVLD